MAGRPKGVKSRPADTSVAEWIRTLSSFDENGCLMWPEDRATTSKGYGSISPGDGRSPMGTHVVIFEERYGPVPAGFMVGHICPTREPGRGQRRCCNIDHLKLTDPKENARENVVGSRQQLNSAKTHCHKGHEFTEENTFVQTKKRNGEERIERVCRTCRNEYQNEWRKNKGDGEVG